jgi:hypothetical protein
MAGLCPCLGGCGLYLDDDDDEDEEMIVQISGTLNFRCMSWSCYLEEGFGLCRRRLYKNNED